MPFESNLELRHRPGHSRWEVIRPLFYRHRSVEYAPPAGDRLIVVPIGYLSDLASVPRLARRIVDPQTPPARRPSVVHDYIYTHLTHKFTKAQADRIFYDALLEEGMPKSLAWLMWKAVSLGGRGAWRA